MKIAAAILALFALKKFPIEKTVDVLDTASDVGSIISNRNMRKKIEELNEQTKKKSDEDKESASSKQSTGNKIMQQVYSIASDTPAYFEKVDDCNSAIQQRLEQQKKGIVEGFVSKITNNMGKPQRQRAIHEYIDLTLIPHFEGQMRQVSSGVLEAIKTTLKQEAEALMAQKRQNLEELEQQYRVSREAFNARRETLLGYKKELEEA